MSCYFGKQLYTDPYLSTIILTLPPANNNNNVNNNTEEAGKPVEMIHIVTPDGNIVTGVHIPSNQVVQQPGSIIQNVVANPSVPGTFVLNSSQQPQQQPVNITNYYENANQPQQAKVIQVTNQTQPIGTYIVNINDNQQPNIQNNNIVSGVEVKPKREGVYIVGMNNNNDEEEQPSPSPSPSSSTPAHQQIKPHIYIVNMDNNNDYNNGSNSNNNSSNSSISKKKPPPPPPIRKIKHKKTQDNQETVYQLPSNSLKNEKQCGDSEESSDDSH